MSTLTSTDTRERLLLAGMHVFAVSGYELGTVREITKRAGANQAAVNYHFGSKAALYEAVVQRAFEHALTPLDAPGVDAPDVAAPDVAAPNVAELGVAELGVPDRGRVALVRAFVSDMVMGALRELTPATHLRIIAAEILRPTGALKALASGGLSNRAPHMARKLDAFADGSAAGDSLLLAHWLLGSCLVALQLAPKSAYGDSDIAQREQATMTENLSALLLNGMNGLAAA